MGYSEDLNLQAVDFFSRVCYCVHVREKCMLIGRIEIKGCAWIGRLVIFMFTF